MKNIIICTITALALAGCITQPSVALDGSTPEAPEVPAGAPGTPAGTPEPAEAPAVTPEANEAPVGEAEQAERDSITEGLICHMEGEFEACRAPDLADMGLAPLPDEAPVTVVTEEQAQELKPAQTKRPGVPKTGY